MHDNLASVNDKVQLIAGAVRLRIQSHAGEAVTGKAASGRREGEYQISKYQISDGGKIPLTLHSPPKAERGEDSLADASGYESDA